MELGNIIFGHSRGEYPVPRTDEYEEPFFALIEKITGEDTCYVPEFENETFVMHGYWWGDCNCGVGDEDAPNHEPTCGTVRPNFLYKSTGYELRVYKYAMRDSYANQNLTPQQFRKMMDKCIKSVNRKMMDKRIKSVNRKMMDKRIKSVNRKMMDKRIKSVNRKMMDKRIKSGDGHGKIGWRIV